MHGLSVPVGGLPVAQAEEAGPANGLVAPTCVEEAHTGQFRRSGRARRLIFAIAEGGEALVVCGKLRCMSVLLQETG